MTAENAIRPEDTVPGRFASAWAVPLCVLGVLLLLLGWTYAGAIAAAVRAWWVSPTFSHCFLIIPISAYLIWERRRALAVMTPAPFPRALLLAIPLILVSLAGKLAAINEVEQLCLIGFVQILVLAVLGPGVYRRVLFPCLFLFFLVPMGEYFITPLQRFTTEFVSAGLSLLGIAHYTQVNTIEVSNGLFEVAEACAGLRFLIATIAVGVLFAHYTYRKWYKIALYLLACVVVPIIGNGFRALGIVLLAHWSNNRIATGADHIIYGWGFSVAILAVLMVVGLRFADRIPRAAPDDAQPAPPSKVQGLLPLAALAVLAILVQPALLYWNAHRPAHFDASALSAPALPGWSVGRIAGDWAPLYAKPDAGLAFAMRDGGFFTPGVDVFVDFYDSGRGGHNLVSSTNKLWNENNWHPMFDGSVHAALGGRPVDLGEVAIASAGVSRLIWWTYWANGRFTRSPLAVKLTHLSNALSGRGGAALVVVSTPVDADVATARARLGRALAALGGLRGKLDAAARISQGAR